MSPPLDCPESGAEADSVMSTRKQAAGNWRAIDGRMNVFEGEASAWGRRIAAYERYEMTMFSVGAGRRIASRVSAHEVSHGVHATPAGRPPHQAIRRVRGTARRSAVGA